MSALQKHAKIQHSTPCISTMTKQQQLPLQHYDQGTLIERPQASGVPIVIGSYFGVDTITVGRSVKMHKHYLFSKNKNGRKRQPIKLQQLLLNILRKDISEFDGLPLSYFDVLIDKYNAIVHRNLAPLPEESSLRTVLCTI